MGAVERIARSSGGPLEAHRAAFRSRGHETQENLRATERRTRESDENPGRNVTGSNDFPYDQSLLTSTATGLTAPRSSRRQETPSLPKGLGTGTRLSLDYIGNVSMSDGAGNASNHRVNSEFDLWLSRRFYLILPFVQYYKDPFQNLSDHVTRGSGIGYDLIDRPKLEWNITTGPGSNMPGSTRPSRTTSAWWWAWELISESPASQGLRAPPVLRNRSSLFLGMESWVLVGLRFEPELNRGSTAAQPRLAWPRRFSPCSSWRVGGRRLGARAIASPSKTCMSIGPNPKLS